jgi:hypothetical protein
MLGCCYPTFYKKIRTKQQARRKTTNEEKSVCTPRWNQYGTGLQKLDNLPKPRNESHRE